MIRKTMILAIATAFIAGSALTSVMSDFEAEAKKKASIDDVLAVLGNLQADVDEIQAFQGIDAESHDFNHEGEIDILNLIKTTTESTNSDVGLIKTGQVESKFILCGIGTSPIFGTPTPGCTP